MIIQTENSVYKVDTKRKTVSCSKLEKFTGLKELDLIELPEPVVGKRCILETCKGTFSTSLVVSIEEVSLV